MKRTIHLSIAALGAFAGALLASAARADTAVVVGVNQYRMLQHANLKGCVNDAQAVADGLRKYGFQVTVLTDDQATRQGILGAIARLKTGGGNERIVFYFAGHGTRGTNGRAVLLPSDAREGDESNDLSAQDLYQAVRDVPARSRTVVLDACFSGGMMRSFKSMQGRRGALQTRYYQRSIQGAATKDLVKVNRADNPNGGNGVCYFAAASENEQAGEDDFNGTRRGVFSYFLGERLNGNRDRWGDVQSNVGGRVAEHMEDTQHPRLSPAFVSHSIFDIDAPGPKPNPPTPPHTLWDDYNGDHVDHTKVEIRMEPDKTTMKVNEQLRLSTTVGASGYLVILERGVQDDIHLLFPESRSADDAQVSSGKKIDIPEPDKAYAPDAPGTERVRAILFSSREKAAALLAQFPPGRSISRAALMRKLVKVDTRRAEFYTSDITFEVRPAQEGEE